MSMHQWQIPCLSGREGEIGREGGGKVGVGEERDIRYR